MRVFDDNQKEEKVTHPFGKMTQTMNKPYSGVCKKFTSVRNTTVGLELHVKTTCLLPLREVDDNQKEEKVTQPLGKMTHTTKSER